MPAQDNKEKNIKYGKGFRIGIIISLFFEALIFLGIFLYEFFVLYESIPTSYNFEVLMSDAFIFPSVIFVLLYLLMWVSKEGTFDAIAYGVKLMFYTIFYKNIRESKLPASYGEYRELKRKKERISYSFLLFASIPFFIVGLIFLILSLV